MLALAAAGTVSMDTVGACVSLVNAKRASTAAPT